MAETLCTAKTNRLYPHAFNHNASVAADASVIPGYDTCGMTETEHADYTPERIREANFFEARYRRAVENTRGHLGDNCFAQADGELLDEAHAEALAEEIDRVEAALLGIGWVPDEMAERINADHDEALNEQTVRALLAGKARMVDVDHAAALREDGERYAAGVIAGSRADQDAIALDLAAMVPADVDDAAAWEVYCKALPEPTDAQIADVLAEYGDPYAAARAEAVAAFKDAARSIWKMRAANQTDTLAVDTIGSLRGSMRTLRDCIEIFDQLTESWQQETRASAARDSYTIRWDDGIVTTVPYSGRRS